MAVNIGIQPEASLQAGVLNVLISRHILLSAVHDLPHPGSTAYSPSP